MRLGDFLRREKMRIDISFPGDPMQGKNVKELWDNGTEWEWRNALSYYYELMRPEQKVREEHIVKHGADTIQKLDELGFYSFLHDVYFVWKYTAKNRLATTRKNLEKYIQNNELSTLKSIQTRLFSTSTDDTGMCLRIACEIYGLGTAGASGLMALLYPEKFGTVDQFVVRRLQEIGHPVYGNELKNMHPEGLKIKDAVILISIMKEKAEQLNKRFGTTIWTPRKLDMVLWAYGR